MGRTAVRPSTASFARAQDEEDFLCATRNFPHPELVEGRMAELQSPVMTPPASHQAQLLLQRAAHHLAEQDVHFLDARGGARGDDEERVGEPLELAAVIAAERGGGEPELARGLQRQDHVRALARGADADGEIAGAAERPELPREELVEAQI